MQAAENNYKKPALVKLGNVKEITFENSNTQCSTCLNWSPPYIPPN